MIRSESLVAERPNRCRRSPRTILAQLKGNWSWLLHVEQEPRSRIGRLRPLAKRHPARVRPVVRTRSSHCPAQKAIREPMVSVQMYLYTPFLDRCLTLIE